MVTVTEYETFVQQHENQLLSSAVPKHFWPTLYQKLTNQTFDSGDSFSLIQIDYEGEEKGEYDPVFQVQVKAEEGIKHTDPKHIYLVDHAWSFQVNIAKHMLNQNNLRERMAGIMGIFDNDKEVVIDRIFDEMWRYVNHYSIGSTESLQTENIWYIMDEFGCGLRHKDDPNFRMVPIIYLPENMAYSLIFPIKDLEFAEVVTRDYLEGITGEARDALALPWVENDFSGKTFEHVNTSPDYFLSGHITETLPILNNLKDRKCLTKYKVFSQYEFVRKYLTDASFEIVENEEDADILWYTQHFKSFEELSLKPHKFVNQFPFEYILTIKDLLSITCRRKSPKIQEGLEIPPKWLPTTYNLKTEIPNFVSYYQNREKQGLDNHWIVKPFNLARGLDTHITKNLNYILRLPATGPKIAQKYIENPILFSRPEIGKVKFDIRYVLLLKSTSPLEAYAYSNFFLRFANKPFELNNFHIYEQHFTVMNYTNPSHLKHMPCAEFKTNWAIQYPNHSWNSVEKSILSMLKEMFECAVIEPPPCGISESPQSRALYAADIMLDWDGEEMQPKLLEVNWTPDCQRACEYYPDFYNDIFKLLFLDVGNDEMFYKL